MSSILTRSSPSAYSRKKSPNVLRNRQVNTSHTASNYNYDQAANQTFLSNNEQTRHDELKQQNDQLYSELRKAKEKCLEVRVENNKLKETNQQLKNQVETFKVKEAASRAASVGRTRRSTQRPGTNKSDNQNLLSLSCIESTGLLCCEVTAFLTSMKALQRAGINKDKDYANYKSDFETHKRQLEKLALQVKQQLEKLPAGGAQRDMGNRCSSSSDIQKIKTSNACSRSTLSSSQTPSHFASSLREPLKRSAKKEHSQEVESRLSMSKIQLRSLKVEKDKQKELLDELRLANKQYASLNSQLKTKALKVQQSYKSESLKNQEYQTLVNEYAQALKSMNTADSNKIYQELQEKAKKITSKQKVSTDVPQPTTTSINRLQKPQKVNNPDGIAPTLEASSEQDKQSLNQLKTQLVTLINQKEVQMSERYKAIMIRVASKERDLDTLKKLFIDKLRELESSFVDISQEVIQNESIQQELLEKRSAMSSVHTESKPQNEVENTVEKVLTKIEQDSREQEIQSLIEANKELLATNEQLKESIKKVSNSTNGSALSSFEDTENIIKLNEQIEILQNTNQEMAAKIKQHQKHESTFKKETQSLKYDNRRLMSDSKEQIQKLKESFAQQQQSLMITYKQLKQSEAAEKEARMKIESQLNIAFKQKQIANTEKQKMESELEQARKAYEEIKQEYSYLNDLKDQSKGAQTLEDQSTTSSNQDQSAEDLQKIEDDPKQAAKDFLKQLNVCKKEMSIQSVEKNKFMQVIGGHVEQLKELKSDNREMTQDNLNLQNKVFDMNAELNKFREQKSDTNDKSNDKDSHEKHIREQVEQEYLPKLEYKDKEVDQFKDKLGKVSATNSEYATKINKLEKANAELEQENSQLNNQLQVLEMDLMIAKQSNDNNGQNEDSTNEDYHHNQQATD